MRKKGRRVCQGLGVLLLLLIVGCQSSYYGQAIRGQWQILVDGQPIRSVLAAPQTPQSLSTKLQLVLQMREFAKRELKLPVNSHYLSYVDLGRKHVVWNVFAAPQFSLAAKTWWYPIVGRLKYRGYFTEPGARHCAERLANQGWDTWIEPVDAYSTLGWFKDPILNTFIGYPEADLAGVLFHELAHLKMFARGDSDFDEAFATVVEEEGVRRWLRHTGQEQVLDQYERSRQFEHEFQQILDRTMANLRQLYEEASLAKATQKESLPSVLPGLQQGKQAAFAHLQSEYIRLREHWPEGRNYSWVTQSPNNAKLASYDTYYRLKPALRRLLADQHNDLPAFYAAVRHLARMPKSERQRAMAATP